MINHLASLPPERLSLKEAAVLSGVGEKTLRHELAGNILQASHARGRVTLALEDLFYLALVQALPFQLGRQERKELFQLIHLRNELAHGSWRWEKDRLLLLGTVCAEIQTRSLFEDLWRKVSVFLKGRKKVESKDEVLGGEPVFAGTRVSVRHVGGLVKRGVPESELLEDFPRLSKEDLEFARIFVELGPPPGRPRKLKYVRRDA
jgi:uncharacterized protein (DUF433 family)